MSNKLNKLSAQLWSVRDYAEKDYFATLEALSKIGYKGIEFAGYYGISARDMDKKLKDLGLEAVSSHVGLDKMKDNLDAELEYLLTCGTKYIVCPSSNIDSVENALRNAEVFNAIGEKTSEVGITLAYHNHAFEFNLDNGKYPIDAFYENVDPRYVKQQPDVYWVAYAGIDVNKYMETNIARCPVIHLKQLENMDTKRNVDAGDGIIDFAHLISLNPSAEFIYEQEEYEGESMDSMRKSFGEIMG